MPALVVGVPLTDRGPDQEVLEAQDPGEQPHEGGQGTDGAGPSPALVGEGEHQSGLAVPPAQHGEATVPPLVPSEGGRGRGRVPSPSPPASSSSTSSRSTCNRQKRLAAGQGGGKAGCRRAGTAAGGGGGASRRRGAHASHSPLRGRALSVRPLVTVRCGGGGGRGGMRPDTRPAAPSAGDSRSAAVAWSHAIPRPPQARLGPPATTQSGQTR